MPVLCAYLFAAMTGAITGVVQWSVFMRTPLKEKTFSAHLDDLRWHLLAAEIVMLLVAGLLALAQGRLDVFECLIVAFGLSWIATVVLMATHNLEVGKHSWTLNDVASQFL
jgi:hypothetical protein